MVKFVFYMLLVAVGAACGKNEPSFIGSIPFKGEVIDILTEDLNHDGQMDVMMTTHGYNASGISYQSKKRQFSEASMTSEVGFHPATMMRWPGEESLYIMNAEGDNQLYTMTIDAGSSLKKIANTQIKAPVQSVLFRWPGWDQGMAVSSFKDDTISLFKGLKPEELTFDEFQQFKASQGDGPSFLGLGDLTVLDADKNGWDEIYYPVGAIRQVRRLQSLDGAVPRESELIATLELGVPEKILSADLDHDGYIDLLIPDSVPGGWVHLMMNDGTGHFKEALFPSLLPNSEFKSFAIKMNKDGSHSLLMAEVNTISLLKFPSTWKEGQSVESVTVPKAFPEVNQAVLLKDLDGDGEDDALIGLDRAHTGVGVRVIYGPLRKNLTTLNDNKWVIN